MRHPSEKCDGGDRSKRSDESSKRRWKPGVGSTRAQRHAVNANQVFYWRKKYREGRLGKNQSAQNGRTFLNFTVGGGPSRAEKIVSYPSREVLAHNSVKALDFRQMPLSR